MMPATVSQITDAVARLTRSTAYRDAEKSLDFWAVVMFGPTQRVPRRFGDNEGAWPVRVGITQDPTDYAARIDLDAGGLHEHVALAHVWTQSRRHAIRVKARLDELLLGATGSNRLRHAWRDICDPDIDWPILLSQALADHHSERIEVFGDEERITRILHAARSHGRRRT